MRVDQLNLEIFYLKDISFFFFVGSVIYIYYIVNIRVFFLLIIIYSAYLTIYLIHYLLFRITSY